MDAAAGHTTGLVCHGVLVAVADAGVLLTGPSGVGKSELALELVSRGHRLIADDSVALSRNGPLLEGRCPIAELGSFLEVRGLGILNIRRLYGAAAVGIEQPLHLIVRLAPPAEVNAILAGNPAARLSGLRQTCELLGITLPELMLPAWPARHLAILIECAVHDLALRNNGYHAEQDFAARLHARPAGVSPCE